MRILWLMSMALAGILVPWSGMARELPRVDYDLIETIRTPTDQREKLIGIWIIPDEMLGMGYRYEERVSGSIDPVVREVHFSNEYVQPASPQQIPALLKSVREAGFFQTASDTDPGNFEYEEFITVRDAGGTKSVTFYSPDSFPMRAAVRKVIFDFVHAVKLDQPADPQAAVILSEGDRQPARRVELRDILAHPDEYNGKRVSVFGYFHGEFEGMTFCVDKDSAVRRQNEKCLWFGEPSSFADANDISKCNDCWMQIEGVFFKGPGGHMDDWPGILARLTKTEPFSFKH